MAVFAQVGCNRNGAKVKGRTGEGQAVSYGYLRTKEIVSIGSLAHLFIGSFNHSSQRADEPMGQ